LTGLELDDMGLVPEYDWGLLYAATSRLALTPTNLPARFGTEGPVGKVAGTWS